MKKFLIFRNSWGSSWGDNGYGYFPEEFILNGPIFDAYVYADVLDLDPTSMTHTLVKLDDVNNKDIWQVRDGKRTLIYNIGAFKALEGNIDQVQKLTQVQFDAIPDSGRALAEIVQE